MSEETQTAKRKSVFREYAEAILIALLLAFFIRTFVVQAFKIPSGSMIPTLLVGDHILVNKFSYGIRNPVNGTPWVPIGEPERGDIVVFKYPVNPSQDFIKRVVGLPGDRIEIRNKQVFVNGNPYVVKNAVFLDANILSTERDNFGPVAVPEGAFFVMGDNRDNSHDSRFWKFVDMKYLKGKAFMLYWSWDRDDFSVRWSRIGNIIR